MHAVLVLLVLVSTGVELLAVVPSSVADAMAGAAVDKPPTASVSRAAVVALTNAPVDRDSPVVVLLSAGPVERLSMLLLVVNGSAVVDTTVVVPQFAKYPADEASTQQHADDPDNSHRDKSAPDPQQSPSSYAHPQWFRDTSHTPSPR